MKKPATVKMLLAIAGTLAATLVATAALAEDKPAPAEWKMSAELGFVTTTGNTETSTTNAKFDATHEKDAWRRNVHAEAFGASNTDPATDVTTHSAERYQLSGKADYKFNEFDYVFGVANYDKDRFSGYNYQATIAAGYGRRVLHEDTMTLDLEIGPGVRKLKDSTTDMTDTSGIVRLAAKYAWQISDTSSFTEDFSSDVSSDLTVTKSVTALTAKVNTSLAMKLTLTVKNNSEVPAGTEKTDTETAVTLVYSF
jgi:putative salt-induced outer membrane protein